MSLNSTELRKGSTIPLSPDPEHLNTGVPERDAGMPRLNPSQLALSTRFRTYPHSFAYTVKYSLPSEHPPVNLHRL